MRGKRTLYLPSCGRNDDDHAVVCDRAGCLRRVCIGGLGCGRLLSARRGCADEQCPRWNETVMRTAFSSAYEALQTASWRMLQHCGSRTCMVHGHIACDDGIAHNPEFKLISGDVSLWVNPKQLPQIVRLGPVGQCRAKRRWRRRRMFCSASLYRRCDHGTNLGPW